MIVTVTRSGGYAEVEETVCLLDTETMPPALAERVGELIEKSNFFALAAESPDAEVGADMFRYVITVQEGVRTHSVGVIVGKGSAPTPVSKLLASLMILGAK
jgi:hypothetical protein